jgi:hypothetical protein
VQHGAVVPDHQVTLPPRMRIAELRLRRELGQPVDEGTALVARPADDMRGVCAGIDRLASVDRIDPQHAVPGARQLGLHVGRQRAGGHCAARIDQAVLRDEFRKLSCDALGQGVVRGAHGGEFGIAALGRHDPCGQQRAQRRHRLERTVRMPEVVALLVDHPPILGRDHRAAGDVAIRLPREIRAHRRVGLARHLQRTEALAECDLAFVIQALIVEHQDGVLIEGRADAREGRVIHRRAGIDAADLGAEQRVQLSNRDRHRRTSSRDFSRA